MHATKDLLAKAEALYHRVPSDEARELLEHFSARRAAEKGPTDKINFRDFQRLDFAKALQSAGITSGKVCEIGGPYNSFCDKMPAYDFEFLSLFPAEGYDNVTVADVTQCDFLAAEQYDAIFSVSVFEHIAKPWKAAENLVRLLKPGGIMYHAAPFSYFYHGAPADYYRYTPDAMQVLFSELRTVKAEFYGKNRRRDNRGSQVNPVDGDGGTAFAVDAFGGWRENWFTIYVGQKDSAYLAERTEQAQRQVIVNAMKTLVDTREMDIDAAAQRVSTLLAGYSVDHDGEITAAPQGSGVQVSPDEVAALWARRGVNGTRVSYARFVTAALMGL